jgi:hypothetical protein
MFWTYAIILKSFTVGITLNVEVVIAFQIRQTTRTPDMIIP